VKIKFITSHLTIIDFWRLGVGLDWARGGVYEDGIVWPSEVALCIYLGPWTWTVGLEWEAAQ
jgi:hypothetical protein